MAKLSIVKGSTSVNVLVFIQDSASITGDGKTGLTAASFTGTKMYVARTDDGNAGGTAVTVVDAARGTWSSGGIKEKDAANMPGWYELGLTNASLASGARSCGYHLQGTGIAPLTLEIELTGQDNQSAGVTVTTNNDKTGYALTAAYDFAKGTVAMTEAYAANGVAPTPVQAIYAIQQSLQNFTISGTSNTVRKLDSITTAFVVTFNDAVAPTAAHR